MSTDPLHSPCPMHEDCRRDIEKTLTAWRKQILGDWRQEVDQILAEFRALAATLEALPARKTLGKFVELMSSLEEGVERLRGVAISAHQKAEEAWKVADRTRERVDNFEQSVLGQLEGLQKAVQELESVVRNGATRRR